MVDGGGAVMAGLVTIGFPEVSPGRCMDEAETMVDLLMGGGERERMYLPSGAK